MKAVSREGFSLLVRGGIGRIGLCYCPERLLAMDPFGFFPLVFFWIWVGFKVINRLDIGDTPGSGCLLVCFHMEWAGGYIEMKISCNEEGCDISGMTYFMPFTFRSREERISISTLGSRLEQSQRLQDTEDSGRNAIEIGDTAMVDKEAIMAKESCHDRQGGCEKGQKRGSGGRDGFRCPCRDVSDRCRSGDLYHRMV